MADGEVVGIKVEEDDGGVQLSAGGGRDALSDDADCYFKLSRRESETALYLPLVTDWLTQFKKFKTFETFDQSDDEAWYDQHFDN